MKIAILTIHKIINCGSALQTYALQHFIENNFSDAKCSIVDYKFPNRYHFRERYKKQNFLQTTKNRLHRLKVLLSSTQKKRIRLFERFWQENLHLTNVYKTQQSMLSFPTTNYDVHILGSDQVWNTKTLCGDEIYLFSYLNRNEYCFSYASSFGLTTLPEKYRSTFKEQLSKFHAIGVREQSAVDILLSLGLKDKTQLVCDPTLLLSADDYALLAKKSDISINDDYILVYCLKYAFNPFPAIKNVIERLQELLQCKVVFINSVVDSNLTDYELIDCVGPYEFAFLFANAKFVVTSSFHGTAFSLINRKPFVSISPRNGDSRISDVLSYTGLIGNRVYNDQELFEFNFEPYSAEVECNIAEYISRSKEFLLRNIKDFQHYVKHE